MALVFNKIMAKVSIIVPVYNVEKYIEKCLESLLNQTFFDLDIIVLNDGSTDSSAEIINKYKLKDSRITYIEKENGGYGSVLEKAISMIDTEYFLICDPDDWLDKNAIETLYELSEENDLDLIIGAKFLTYDGCDEIIYDNSKFDCCENIKSGTVYNEHSAFNYLQPSPHSKLYRTSLCKDIIFPHKVSFTDYLLYLMALSKSKRVMYIDTPLSYYYIDRPGNSMTSVKEKVFSDHIIVLKSLYDQMALSGDEKIYSRIFFQFRNVVLMMAEKGTLETKNKYYDEYLNFLRKMSKNRSMIIKYLPKTNLKEKIYFSMMLSKYFDKYLLKRMMRVK